MSEYHKIHSIFKRCPITNKLLGGEFSKDYFEYLQNNPWTFTEKVDGTNIRIIIHNGNITFKGRTENAQLPSDLVRRLIEIFHTNMGYICDLFPSEIPTILYGEGYGGKIEHGNKYLLTQDFVLFDVKVGSFWLQRKDVDDISKKLQIRTVPTIGVGSLWDGIKMCKTGFNSDWGNFEAEGIVARPVVEVNSRNHDRIICKIKICDFKC